MPLATIYQMMLDEKKQPYMKFLDAGLIPTQEEFSNFNPIEDVILIGYPIGLWDARNNLPIVRRGVTATSPAIDHNGLEEFMIDAACFPGSSGSPVLIHNTGIYSDGLGIVFGNRTKLLGILYAGPTYDFNGRIQVTKIPTTNVAHSITSIPVNLGYVIKSRRILGFEPIFREQLEKNRVSQVIFKETNETGGK